MAKESRKKQVTWMVPVKLYEDFKGFCGDGGTILQDDAAGALWLWQRIPAQIRQDAKLAAKGIHRMDEEFWEFFQAGLDAAYRVQVKSPVRKPDTGD